MDSNISIKKIRIIRGAIKYLIFLLMAFLLIYTSSLWTSPAFVNWYGCDCSFFTMVGRGITQGLIPYRDFFDLKGPYFFLIEAIGQFIHKDRLGDFIIQVFFMSFSYSILWKMARLYLGRLKSAAVVIIFTIAEISMLWGGNTLEEYMIPVNLLAIFLTVRFLKDNSVRNSEIPMHVPLVSGLCFGIITFAKITVGAPIAGMCLAIGLSLIGYRRIKEFFKYCLYFLLGFLIALVPVFIFYAIKGCLLYMLYCVFDFAFKRGTDFSDPFNFEWEVKLAGCYFAFLVGLLHLPRVKKEKPSQARSAVFEVQNMAEANSTSPKLENNELSINSYEFSAKTKKQPTWLANFKILSAAILDESQDGMESFMNKLSKTINKDDKHHLTPELSMMLIIMSLITIVLLHLGSPFIYYFMTTLPTAMLALILLLDMYKPLVLFTNIREAVCLLVIAVFIFYYGGCSVNTIIAFTSERDTATGYQEYYDNCQEMASLIPEYDRDSVFSFDIDMNWFEINQIMPCYKYQINLQFFIALDPRIETDILERFDTNPPKWLVVSHTLDEYLPTINDMVQEKYDCIYVNDVGCLMLLRE